MGLDLVTIALDSFTDATSFEDLASAVMYGEGYVDLKPLGGSGDQGVDASQERLYTGGRKIKTVFQYTLVDYLEGKLKDTVAKLRKNKVDFTTLVLVTPRPLSAARQRNLEKLALKEYEVELKIYERKVLANRLGDFSNGLFPRFFPSLREQLAALPLAKPIFGGDDQLEAALLRVSIAFVFGERADHLRKTLFDGLVVGILLKERSGVEQVELLKGLKAAIGKEIDRPQLAASVKRLERQGAIKAIGSVIRLAAKEEARISAAVIEVNAESAAFVSDAVDEACRAWGPPVAEQDRQRLLRNARDVLSRLLRLVGVEIANQFGGEGASRPLYLEASSEIVKLAGRQLPEELGIGLVTALGNMIAEPTAEQARCLAQWGRAFVGMAVMNLDPMLRELQITRLRNKTFFLDTDVVLECAIREHPRHPGTLALIENLVRLGCRVVVADSVVEECARHASVSVTTYNYFGSSLFGLSRALVQEKVHNAFVEGFYYARTQNSIPGAWTFRDYLLNYVDSKRPVAFMTEVIRSSLPKEVRVLDSDTLLDHEPPAALVRKVTGELYDLALRSRKSAKRTPAETRALAGTDARLFLTAQQLNGDEGVGQSEILGGNAYIVTNSGRYLIAAKKVGLRDPVSTRPQQLLSILELVGGPVADDLAFVSLFENPLLRFAVDRVWDDVKVLLDVGVSLEGKSLTRLRRDLDVSLHRQIAAMRANGGEGKDTAKEGRSETLVEQVRRSAVELGYGATVQTAVLLEEVTKLRKEKEDLRGALDTVSGEIRRFGKRRQRYLKRVLKSPKKK